MNTPPETAAVRLSVILITKNEVHNIKACLNSVDFADEIIVVDSGSTDGTVELARAAGAVVIETTDWPGFGPQKNRALEAARGEWVLSIDADERITPELADEIRQAIEQRASADACDISRRSWYCGRFIKHSGWTPDYVTRLFRRGKAKFTNDIVHEHLVVEGSTQRLKSVMLHYSFRDFSQVLQKIDNYSTLSARQAYARGRRASVGQAVLHGMWAFMRTYFLRLGFLDGANGLALAISNAEGSYYRYLKIWLLDQQDPLASSSANTVDRR
ncbi:glycosyltransferase family 2 protein [Noviherbaspirillum cavernae]|uniref:Glycosyltransferase family 2 protein n=1 Tax=Noviherbaspirillum cavernae TaxID=2320862 RepID=A0A418X6I1_9BURK|nr:glycosyltransferase family 2 protein [Noviherbaspirillum cavernae]RJG08082.1 glycosyltransferase family 2 protein [Noviherbaspirillum cavernae]